MTLSSLRLGLLIGICLQARCLLGRNTKLVQGAAGEFSHLFNTELMLHQLHSQLTTGTTPPTNIIKHYTNYSNYTNYITELKSNSNYTN